MMRPLLFVLILLQVTLLFVQLNFSLRSSHSESTDTSLFYNEYQNLKTKYDQQVNDTSNNCSCPFSINDTISYVSKFKSFVGIRGFSTFAKIGSGSDLWKQWENEGVHVLPVSYYSPYPSSKDLDEHYTKNSREMFALHDVNVNVKLRQEIFDAMTITYADEVKLFPELSDDPISYFYKNDMFGLTDASLYYSIIRMMKPSKIIEVGSGNSLKVSLVACKKNFELIHPTTSPLNITVIEPYPGQGHNSFLQNIKTKITLIQKRVQNVDLDEFSILNSNDILFIDSSHVVATGSDTVYEVLKILPSLNPGVIIHFHDIFLPDEMPNVWTQTEHRSWSEQYLIHAFLLFNSEFEIIAQSHYYVSRWNKNLTERLGQRFNKGGGSIWLRRKIDY